MAYAIVYSQAVREQIRHLPGHIKAVAKQHIAELSQNPHLPRSKALEGYPGYYRIWLDAKHRLVWHVIDAEQLVELDYVGPKTPDLYAYLGLGRQND